uniref:Uncharacterized protein n=1 Tax=Magallana gigas TaxID=29159 RepID=K1R3M9_MAGGI
MATGGDKKQVSGNVSDGNMTQEEIDQLVKTLSAMKVKPKADSPEDLLSWMQRMQVQPPEWLQRANYLQTLATTGVFDKIDKDSAKALVNIITGK